MTDLLFSLLGGVVLIGVVFVLLHRFSRLNAKATGLLLMLLVLGLYVPVSILAWPGADVFAIHIAVYLVTVYVLAIAGTSRETREDGKRGLHWGPALIILFFLLVIGMNSVFIMLAQKGLDADLAGWLLPEPGSGGRIQSFFPGTVGRDFYEKEADYKAYLERQQAQQERGWQLTLGWAGPAVAGRELVFRVRIADRSGQAIRGARISGRFLRPGNVRQDRDIRLRETEPGLYQTTLRLPEPGRWDVILDIRKDDIVHEVNARTTVAEAGS